MKNKEKIVEEARKKIQSLHKEQDKIYTQLIKDLGITNNYEEGEDFLWDYVFNCNEDSNPAYLEMSRKKIFGT
jgi:RNAse (barnase) inhibitor barstar